MPPRRATIHAVQQESRDGLQWQGWEQGDIPATVAEDRLHHGFPQFHGGESAATHRTLARGLCRQRTTGATAPAVTVGIPREHQLMHPRRIHGRQRFLLAEDGQVPMSGTIDQQLHGGLFLFPLVALQRFLGDCHNMLTIVLHVERQQINDLLLHRRR